MRVSLLPWAAIHLWLPREELLCRYSLLDGFYVLPEGLYAVLLGQVSCISARPAQASPRRHWTACKSRFCQGLPAVLWLPHEELLCMYTLLDGSSVLPDGLYALLLG